MVVQLHPKPGHYQLLEILNKFELVSLDILNLKEKKCILYVNMFLFIYLSFNLSRINEPTPDPVPPAIE